MSRTLPDTDFFRLLLPDYLAVLLVERGLAANSVVAYRRDLEAFGRWLATRGLDAAACERAHLRRYLTDLRGRGLAARSAARALAALRGLYRYMVERGVARQDPTLDLESPKLMRSLPYFLSAQEIEVLLAAPDLSPPAGLEGSCHVGDPVRHRRSCLGARRPHVNQLRLDPGYVRVWGKGSKERIVPVGSQARKWLALYLEEARPGLDRSGRKRSSSPFAVRG